MKTKLTRLALVVVCGLCFSGCGSNTKREIEALKRENETLRNELSSQKQQLNSRERAKIVEAYNICKQSYEEVALYVNRNSSKERLDTTDTEWVEFYAGQKRKLSNVLAEIDPNSPCGGIVSALREFLVGDKFQLYAWNNFWEFTWLHELRYREKNGYSLEMIEEAKKQLDASRNGKNYEIVELEKFVGTQIERPISQMGITVDPFFH